MIYNNSLNCVDLSQNVLAMVQAVTVTETTIETHAVEEQPTVEEAVAEEVKVAVEVEDDELEEDLGLTEAEMKENRARMMAGIDR